MKKWIALLLALMMCLSLCACGGKSDTAKDATNNTGDSEQKTEVESIELNIPVGDDFTIVEATYTTDRIAGDTVSAKFKIQNNSEENFEVVQFYYFFYDKNGDKTDSLVLSVDDMEAGHATWTSYIDTDLTLDEFGSIKIDDYEIQQWIDDSTVETVRKVSLDPKPEVLFEQMTQEA